MAGGDVEVGLGISVVGVGATSSLMVVGVASSAAAIDVSDVTGCS
jgi:hypothetical protein